MRECIPKQLKRKNVLWDDDSQIMSLLIIKNYDKNDPRIEMEIN